MRVKLQSTDRFVEGDNAFRPTVLKYAAERLSELLREAGFNVLVRVRGDEIIVDPPQLKSDIDPLTQQHLDDVAIMNGAENPLRSTIRRSMPKAYKHGYLMARREISKKWDR